MTVFHIGLGAGGCVSVQDSAKHTFVTLQRLEIHNLVMQELRNFAII
jgi:hypothetical protein